jgi:hypothetical protein
MTINLASIIYGVSHYNSIFTINMTKLQLHMSQMKIASITLVCWKKNDPLTLENVSISTKNIKHIPGLIIIGTSYISYMCRNTNMSGLSQSGNMVWWNVVKFTQVTYIL